MDAKLKEKIEKCTTEKQVRRILVANGIQIVRDTSSEVGCFSVWIDRLTRIYKPHKRKYMAVQVWRPVDMTYSGAPMFSARNSFF